MKIYDISQEVFTCNVFPGDPQPERIEMMKIKDGEMCNLTALKMCAHNGTHVDAPYHFIDGGKTIDMVDMSRFVGLAYVASHEGNLKAEDARRILDEARKAEETAGKPISVSNISSGFSKDSDEDHAYYRILVKGNATVTEEAAKVFAEAGILLFGNESQTVGPEDAPKAVHLIMLGAEIVLLEGIRLSEVEDGIYLLNAAPINLGGADGAPCRAILME